jgi:hypothetical protein
MVRTIPEYNLEIVETETSTIPLTYITTHCPGLVHQGDKYITTHCPGLVHQGDKWQS